MFTLQVVKMLGKNELELFERICYLLIDNECLPRELFTGRVNVEEFTQDIGIDFGSLQTLQSLGLFLPNDMTRTITITGRKNLVIKYFDKELVFTPTNENFSKIRIPNFYGLSIVGKQILKHLKLRYVEKYYLWIRQNYKIPNYELKSSNL